ncbi:MAG TPA: ABC transporter ATP-binding protein [Chitinispirillaceae bacterium]|nr:ABC transporter ATP-binding protein [Chitinispirillaceae bacterium]
MIRLQSLTKQYGTLTVLNHITFEINRGDFFALLGPNGAGKTTMIRILLDFTRADSGNAIINGISSRLPGARKGIGYLPENLNLPAYLSGREYLLRHAGLCDLSGKEAEKAIERVLEIVGMKERQRSHCGTYSKGMVQRIGLAASLIFSPQLLILDEPTNGLDPIGIREFRIILENLKQQGTTLFLNSHILSEVERICDTVAVMDKGNLLVKDAISNLLYEGETLEDVFVRLVGKK